jgi:hypothetical protein
MTTAFTVTCDYVDHCFSDYLTDHRGILVGIAGTGQTAADIALEAAQEAIGDEDMPEGVTLEQLTVAALGELDDTAKFWPVDDKGEEVTDDGETADEQPLHWFRFAATPDVDDSELAEFIEGYISCALWCGVLVEGEDGEIESSHEGGDESELTDEARAKLTEEATEFYTANLVELRASTLDMSRAGHDFWLTRNRHGAGYWDEGYRGSKEATDALQYLTDAAHAYGEQSLALTTDDNGDATIAIM